MEYCLLTEHSPSQDCGCGVGGPAREIASFTGAKVIGINNNAYQVGPKCIIL